jgi:hypothetical protein
MEHPLSVKEVGPNLLKISESALSQKVKRYCVPPPKSESRKEAVICMGKKNAGANQAHERCNCLDHRNVQSAPARTQRLPRCTVKRIPSENRKWAPTDDLAQQFRQWRAAPGARAADGGGRAQVPRAAQIGGSPRQRLIHHDGALPISAAFGLRYVHSLVRRWAASGTSSCRAP